jgi:hypothetical protein
VLKNGFICAAKILVLHGAGFLWFVGGFILAYFLRCFVTSKQKATNKTQIQKEAT